METLKRIGDAAFALLPIAAVVAVVVVALLLLFTLSREMWKNVSPVRRRRLLRRSREAPRKMLRRFAGAIRRGWKFLRGKPTVDSPKKRGYAGKRIIYTFGVVALLIIVKLALPMGFRVVRFARGFDVADLQAIGRPATVQDYGKEYPERGEESIVGQTVRMDMSRPFLNWMLERPVKKGQVLWITCSREGSGGWYRDILVSKFLRDTGRVPPGCLTTSTREGAGNVLKLQMPVTGIGVMPNELPLWAHPEQYPVQDAPIGSLIGMFGSYEKDGQNRPILKGARPFYIGESRLVRVPCDGFFALTSNERWDYPFWDGIGEWVVWVGLYGDSVKIHDTFAPPKS